MHSSLLKSKPTNTSVDDDPNTVEPQSKSNVVEGPSSGDGCWKGFRASPHCKNWFLTLGLWTLFVVYFVCLSQLQSLCECDCWDPPCPSLNQCDSIDIECSSPCDFTYESSTWWWVCAVVGYVLYIAECAFAGSHRFLLNTHVKETIYQFVKRIQRNTPSIWWKVVCWHYETRTRTVTSTDSNGRTTTRTEHYQVRVDTHSASMNYKFNSWRDISIELTGLEHYKLTKLYCSKTWVFGDSETRIDYNQKLQKFKADNNRDVYQDFSCGMDIPGYKSHLLAEVESGISPKCLNVWVYWMFSIFTLSVFFRHWFDSIVGRKKYTFVKRISIQAKC